MKSRVITGSFLAITFLLCVLLLPPFILGIFFTLLFVYAFIEWLSITSLSSQIKIIYLSLFVMAIFMSLNISRELLYDLISFAIIFWTIITSLIILKSSLLKYAFLKLAPIFGFLSLYLSWMIVIHMSSEASLPEINQSIINIFQDDGFDNVRGYFLLIITIVSLSDIAGYLVGKRFGKFKLCEDISPNKTIEGFLASIIIPSVLLITYFTIYKQYPLMMLDVLLMAMCCISCTIGDLFISTLKRAYNKKDSGSLLPGHGGLLDRLDSYLLSTIVYYYWMFI